MTHAPASHARVPAAFAGHKELSQVAAPQPNVGSSIETHCPPQFFMPTGQAPTTQAPLWHASVPTPASGQVDSSQVALAHP
jgi:hypothetical protein